MWAEKTISFFMKRDSKKYLRLQSQQNTNLPRNSKDKKYLLYIHIPFCEKLCPYCSFNRYELDLQTAKNYFIALRQELTMYKELGYDCTAAYLGGGTPTILLDELRETLELTKKIFSVKEISIETNPNHLTQKNIRIFKEMGVNRISVGVQSFNDPILKTIDRYQKYGSSQEIKEKISFARDKFHTLNVDMIFNFPNQTMKMLEYDLDSILELGVDQVTFYPLMFAQSIKNKLSDDLGMIDYRKEKKFYLKILDKLSGHLEPATAWCFSRNKGLIDEYIVNHDEYLGLGSGSFGLINGSIIANTFSLEKYIHKLKDNQLPISFSKKFSNQELMRYDFLMQLFSRRLNIKKLKEKYPGEAHKSLKKEILFLQMLGGITKKGDFLHLTRKGLYYWVIIMREFFTGVNNLRDYCRKLNIN